MAAHNDLGKLGEELAVAWFQEHGYEILQRNWRSCQYEIDIIARKEGRLHFIEVKLRKYHPGSNPENSVTRQKFRSLKNAAAQYLYMHPHYKWIQYDILAITLRNEVPEYFLIEDVFL